MTKIALITGAGTGIGKSCAHELVHGDYHVIFTGRRLNVLESAIDEQEGMAEAIACDVSESEEVRALFRTIAERHGRLDVIDSPRCHRSQISAFCVSVRYIRRRCFIAALQF